MWHANDGCIEAFGLRFVGSFGEESVQGYGDCLTAFRRVSLMRSELLLHERLHQFSSHEQLQRLNLLLGGDWLPRDPLESFMAPEPLILIRYMLKLNGCRATVRLVEILMHVKHRATFLVQSARYSIVLLVCTQAI